MDITVKLPEQNFTIGEYVLIFHNMITIGVVINITANIIVEKNKDDADLNIIDGGWQYGILYGSNTAPLLTRNIPESAINSCSKIKEEVIASGVAIVAFKYSVSETLIESIAEDTLNLNWKDSFYTRGYNIKY